MGQDVKMQNQILSLFNSLRHTLGYYNLLSNAVRLIFLRYLISYSDKFDSLGIDSFKAITAFKRKYDSSLNFGEPLTQGDIANLFSALDSDHIFGNNRLLDLADGYELLFKDCENQRKIIQTINEVDIDYNKDFLINFFEFLIQQCSRDVRRTGESITNKSLRQLSVKILDIKKDDVVLNCFSGYSTFLMSLKEYNRYYGYEINRDVYSVSKMLLAMLGISDACIYNSDFLLEDTHNLAEKIFSDGPLMARFDDIGLYKNPTWLDGLKTHDGNILILRKTLDSLKDGGTMVAAVHSKVLFSNHSSYVELRKEYLDSGLRAVISLPPLWYGISTNTNLIVLEKGYKGDVQFIDAQKLGVSDKQRNSVLLDTDIDKILDAYAGKKNIAGFSKMACASDILTIGTWQPNRFVEIDSKQEYKDINEIDSELNSLYEQLKNNLK